MRGATPDELAERAIGGRHILFELVPRTGRADALAALEAVRAAGLEAIVGHPERSVDVQHDPTIVEELRSGGALIQVVGPSLLGRVSDAVRTSAWGLLEAGLVDLVGSDAHRPSSPSLRLDLVADLIAQRSDRATAERLLVETPSSLAPLVLGGAVAAEERGGGEQDRLQVEPRRPVLDVVVVPLDAVLERRLAAQAVDLRPAGDADLDAVAVVVAVDVSFEKARRSSGARAAGRRCSCRPDDVEQLRQLVERRAAHELADRACGGRRPRRRRGRASSGWSASSAGFGVAAAHRAELEHVERLRRRGRRARWRKKIGLPSEIRTASAITSERAASSASMSSAATSAVERVLDCELPAARVDRRAS